MWVCGGGSGGGGWVGGCGGVQLQAQVIVRRGTITRGHHIIGPGGAAGRKKKKRHGEYTFDHWNASFSEWGFNGKMINGGTLLQIPTPINFSWLDDEISLQGMSSANSNGSSRLR